VTGAATARAGEVRRPRLGIADEDIENLVEAAVRILVDRRMQERREVGVLGGSQVEFGHASIGPADLKKLAELSAVLVGLHELGSRQVGAAGAAARVGAMAEAALLDVEPLAALDRRGIGRRGERLLLSGRRNREQKRKPRKGRMVRQAHHERSS
jgi:hypothetical protein